MNKKMKVLLTIGMLILLGLAFYFISYVITKYTGYSITGKPVYSKEEKIQIGECLREKGVALYCSHLSIFCLNQKSTLGIVFNKLNYVDCNENFEECEDLRGLPAWKINNRIYYGIQNLNQLAELSGCKIN